jgi:phosphohistidine swiveling domain-containing protein
MNTNDVKQKWKKKIISNKKEKEINNYLILPPLISEKNNFNIVEYYLAHPNFITEKSIISETLILKKDIAKRQLNNKIIILENADPGYDWIFSCNPSGLITKYGGVASHMSIRCSEIGLPAVIGCGEILYENILESSKILLDCKNNEILIIEQLTDNQFLEERKVLKSLGYIK